MSGQSIPYTCDECDFEADDTHCDECDGIVFWEGARAICSGCGMRIQWTRCRNCGEHVADL
jgi:hypothetical protein